MNTIVVILTLIAHANWEWDKWNVLRTEFSASTHSPNLCTVWLTVWQTALVYLGRYYWLKSSQMVWY